MRVPEAFRSLRYPDFRVFFVAQTISQTATWMHSVAQTWLILSLTNSPLLLGLITMLHWGPILLLALPSGAIADRVAKRRLLMATQAAQACTALTVAMLAATGVVAYWHVGVLAVCAGLANALFNVVRQLGIRASFCLLGPLVGYGIDGWGLPYVLSALGILFSIAFVFLLLPLVLPERSLSPAEGVTP